MLESIRKRKKTKERKKIEYFQICYFFAPNFRLFFFSCFCVDAVRWPKVKATREKPKTFFFDPKTTMMSHLTIVVKL